MWRIFSTNYRHFATVVLKIKNNAYVLSEDAFVFSEEEVFSYSVVDLRGIRPAVRFVAVVPSNLFVVPRGLAGEDKDAEKSWMFLLSTDASNIFITYLIRR